MIPRRVFILTGAGISAESGIPTFRSAGGYWRNFDPLKLATCEAFDAQPDVVWQWYNERRGMTSTVMPNAAHVAVTRLAQAADAFLLVTQNVDDLHRRALYNGHGLRDDQMVPIHGDLFVTRCEACRYSRRDDARAGFPGLSAVEGSPPEEPGVPPCPKCSRRLRPGVVWFGEMLDPALCARVERFLAPARCDVTIVIGTSAQFPYVVQWATWAARGGRLIEINPEETPLSPFATETIREPAAVALPRLVEALLSSQ